MSIATLWTEDLFQDQWWFCFPYRSYCGGKGDRVTIKSICHLINIGTSLPKIHWIFLESTHGIGHIHRHGIPRNSAGSHVRIKKMSSARPEPNESVHESNVSCYYPWKDPPAIHPSLRIKVRSGWDGFWQSIRFDPGGVWIPERV